MAGASPGARTSAQRSPSISREIGNFAAGVRFADLPTAVQTHASQAFMNWLGCIYGGCQTEVVDATIRGLSSARSRDGAHVIGRSERLDPVDAALINCLSSSVHAFDDTHLATITHPTGPVAAACLALAETHNVTTEQFYAALIVGMEVECRLANALLSAAEPAGRASTGWHMTGLAGGAGAAVAASMLLGSTPEVTEAAIGIAATQAGGFRSAHGDMVMPLIPALAAKNGLQAALWAAAGMRCNDRLLEASNGLFDVLAPGADTSLVCSGLGTNFIVCENAFKPYPCGIVVHPVIDGCLEVFHHHSSAHDDIARIDIMVHPVGKKLADRLHPKVEFEAQVSTQFCAAVSLICGEFKLDHLTPAWFERPDVLALQHKLFVIADPLVERDAARLHVTLQTGENLVVTIDHATGSQARPMSKEDLVAKFHSQSDPVLGPIKSKKILEILASPNNIQIQNILNVIEWAATKVVT